MISGTIQRGYVWRASVPAAILGALVGAMVYLLGLTIGAHGVAGINSGFLVAFGISAFCLGMVAWHIVNLRRTVREFAFDGQTLRFETFGSRERVRELAQIARVESRQHTNSWRYRIVLRDGGVLLLVPRLRNAAELAQQLEIDLAYLRAAAAGSGDAALSAEFLAMAADAPVLRLRLRRRKQWQTVGTCFMVLAVISFVSGFYFGGQKIDQSGLPRNFRAEQKGDRFYAVKSRGGQNPPSFEITGEQYRLWKEGDTIHGFFHLGACFCFLVAWVIFGATQRNPAARPPWRGEATAA